MRADQRRAIARKERERWLRTAHEAAQMAKREVFSAQTAAYAAEKEVKLAIERCATALGRIDGVETLLQAIAESEGTDLSGAADFAERFAAQMGRPVQKRAVRT